MKTADTITSLEAWMIGEAKDAATFFAAIALADLENKPFRLSAESQRQLFGKALLGRQKLFVRDNSLTVSRKVCFGTDAQFVTLDAPELNAFIAQGRKINQ